MNYVRRASGGCIANNTRSPSLFSTTNTHLRRYSIDRPMSGKSASRVPVATPRPSASLLIVNSRNEILLVQRNPKARSFAGIHVFPGGNVDPEDGDSYAMTAIRETFEESGLLLASHKSASSAPPQLDEAALDNARTAILKQETTFKQFLSDNNLTADIDQLLPFTQWVTPPMVPTRFHTHFFVTFLSTSPSAGFSSGTKEQFLPTPDSRGGGSGRQEVVSTRFVHPLDALSQFTARKVSFMPPQFYLLHTLSDILHGTENTHDHRARVTALSKSPFGFMVVRPQPLFPVPKGTPDGYHVLTYNGDETRGGRPGRLHRILFKNSPSMAPLEITLQRNFSIFAAEEFDHSFSNESKL